MSAYLTFFELEQSPFEGTAQSQVVLGTRALRDAFGTIRSGLEEGASRICVSGGAGLGKTSLARAAGTRRDRRYATGFGSIRTPSRHV